MIANKPNALPTEAIEILAAHFKGKRREEFLTSVAVISDGLANNAWLPKRGHAQAWKGFGKGLTGSRNILRSVNPHRNGQRASDPKPAGTSHNLYMLLAFGTPLNAEQVKARNDAYPMLEPETPWQADGSILPVEGLSAELVSAWAEVCSAAQAAIKHLDAARRKPVVTSVGLSPRVTATIQEMNLDLILSTITPAEIEAYESEVLDKNGNPQTVTFYRVKWSVGCKLGLSRFRYGCEACGRHIPSGRYVPVEVDCKRNGRVGLWLGCDCARNIFGVKDAGIAKALEHA